MLKRDPTSSLLPDRPAWVALVMGLVFAGALAFAHKAHMLPALGVLGAVAFCWAATIHGPSPRRIALLFALPGVFAYAWLQNWLIGITAPGYVGLVMVMTLFLATAMWLAVRVARRMRSTLCACLVAGVMLAAMDFTRGRVFLSGYPWYTLGQPTLDILGVPTLASWIGMYGVNTLVCVFGALLAVPLLRTPCVQSSPIEAVLAARSRMLALLIPFLLVVLTPGTISRALAPTPPDPEAGVPIAVVQTNVPQSNKQSSSLDDKIAQFASAVRLTRTAHDEALTNLGAAPALIVWPETMFPGAALNDDGVNALRDAPADTFALTGQMRDALVALQSSLGDPFLIGAIALENPRVVPADEPGYVRLEHDGLYNSAFLLEQGRVEAARYDKMHLTPFGEVMPVISRWPWLEAKLLAFGAPGMSFDLDAGTEPVRFDAGPLRLAAPICFEATIPAVCRGLVFEHGERRANVLVNLTNDGWFGSVDAARRDHLLLARRRAAELATPVVRAANTGISCFIDAQGRVYSRQGRTGVWRPGALGDRFTGPARTEGVLLARIIPGEGTTLYARTGDTVGWMTFAAGGVLVVLARRGSSTKNRANPEGSPNAGEPAHDRLPARPERPADA